MFATKGVYRVGLSKSSIHLEFRWIMQKIFIKQCLTKITYIFFIVLKNHIASI